MSGRRRKVHMMREARRTLAVGALALAGTASLHGQEVERLAGSYVAVHNLAGSVEVVRGSGSDVVVRIERGGVRAEELSVETGQVGERTTLRVVFPGDEIVYPHMGRGSSTIVSVRPDGTLGDGDSRRGRRVRIRGSGDGVEAWADLVVEVPSGRTLSVHLGAGDITSMGVSGAVRLETGTGGITVADLSGSLEVETGSGAVSVRRVDGSLSAKTGSGGVEAAAVAGDDVELGTGSGRVRASGIQARRFAVDTGSGSVTLEGVSAPVVLVETGSGSVDLELLSDVERLEVETGSGSVTLRAAQSLGATVELDTGSGGIDLEFPLEARSARRDRVEGRLGDGEGTLRIETGAGSIRVLRIENQLQ